MGKETEIPYCDSTLNLEMGCNGCELWNPKNGGHCYAAIQCVPNSGTKGWPTAFDRPEVFADRIKCADSWSDMRQQHHPLKPWLYGLPRVVFLNDMGDTFTEALPWNWLAPFLDALKNSRHFYMILTKRPTAMKKFFDAYECPPNFALGVSVTDGLKLVRVDTLLSMDCIAKQNRLAFVSAEPMLGRFDIPEQFRALRERGLWIVGGESGPEARRCNLDDMLRQIQQGLSSGLRVFCKQLGSFPYDPFISNRLPLRDSKGANDQEWPAGFRVRQFWNMDRIEWIKPDEPEPYFDFTEKP